MAKINFINVLQCQGQIEWFVRKCRWRKHSDNIPLQIFDTCYHVEDAVTIICFSHSIILLDIGNDIQAIESSVQQCRRIQIQILSLSKIFTTWQYVDDSVYKSDQTSCPPNVVLQSHCLVSHKESYQKCREQKKERRRQGVLLIVINLQSTKCQNHGPPCVEKYQRATTLQKTSTHPLGLVAVFLIRINIQPFTLLVLEYEQC